MALKLVSKKKFILAFTNEDGTQNKDSEVPVACQVHRLRMADLFKVQNKVAEIAKEGQSLEDVASNLNDPVQAQQFWEIASFVIAKYTSDWENISVDGAVLTAGEDVVNEMGSENIELVAAVFLKVLNVSEVSEGEAKNSVSDSDQGNLGSDSIAPVVFEMDSEKKETAVENMV